MLGGGPVRGRGGWRRAVALAALSVLALMLHAGLLGGLERPVGAVRSNQMPAALTVRTLVPLALPPAASPPAPAAESVAARLPAEPAGPRAKPVAATTRADLPAPPARRAPPAAEAKPMPAPAWASAAPLPAEADVSQEGLDAPAVALTAAPVAEPPPSPAALGAPSPAGASDRELPVYRTLIPPPLAVHYLLRRGALQGTGELHWLPQGDRYEARLEGRLAGGAALAQVSQGGFDEAGVAPLRFTDRRAAGAVQAANFQREAGKISFSGPSVEYPLLIGSQDRLSWMIQLAAVLAAEPQRLEQGGKVVIHVVGARGDSSLWIFRFAGLETIAAGAGTIRSSRWVREAEEIYGTRVEVWLDPLRHHLPARAVLRSGTDDDVLELLAQQPVATP